MNLCNQSVRGHAWQLRPLLGVPDMSLGTFCGVPLGRLLPEVVARRTDGTLSDYLSPTLKAHMPDPFALLHMEEAAQRMCDAILKGEPMALYGDYDVDGATSVATVILYLRMLGVREPIYDIPQRADGYGPNASLFSRLREHPTQPTLLVVLDSGTPHLEQIAHARAIGFDVIILDHHEPRQDLRWPDAITVNPKNPLDKAALAHLCTAGLSFVFCVGVNRCLRQAGYFTSARPEPDIRDLLALTSLGTVADVVKLAGLNRAFVALGLKRLEKNLGIREILAAVNRDREETAPKTKANGSPYEVKLIEPGEYACGFFIGPCINAGGRMGDTHQGTEILIERHEHVARSKADRLYRYNRERREEQRAMVDKAIAMVEDQIEDAPMIVVSDPTWNAGIIGLVAGNLKDRFDRPALAIGANGKGSGRSVPGFNLGVAFGRAKDFGLCSSGGGHEMAGGLAVSPERIPELKAFLNAQVAGFSRRPDEVDLVLAPEDLTLENVLSFDFMRPFGEGNRSPCLVLLGCTVTRLRDISRGGYKMFLEKDGKSVEAVAFGVMDTPMGEALSNAQGAVVDVMGEATVNWYGGRSTVQIKIMDIFVRAAAADALAA